MAGVGATERTWLKIWCGTWNVYSVGPPSDISDWLGLDAGGESCDIYAVGLQEANASPVAWTSELVAFDPWTAALSDLLCAHGLTRLFVRRVFGLLISVFVRVNLLPWVDHLEFSKIRTSMTGKGTVAIRFRVRDFHVAFLNCHFCPHVENISVRNREYFRTVNELRFSDPLCHNLLDHHYILWMGDFNYRLDKVSGDFVKNAITQEKIDDLRQYDQLSRERELGYVFNDFHEGIINFLPSYKFGVKTHEYDYTKARRLPSWCDRIQWRIQPPGFEADGTPILYPHDVRPSLQLLLYNCHPQYTNSDHKPVSGCWLMAVPSLNNRPAPVVVVQPQAWCCGKTATIQYEVQETVPTSKWDWIALYRTGWQWQKDYVTYVWAAQVTAGPSSLRSYKVNLEARYMPSEPGQYQLVYYSADTNLGVLGVSDAFLILPGDSSPDKVPLNASINEPVSVDAPQVDTSGSDVQLHAVSSVEVKA